MAVLIEMGLYKIPKGFEEISNLRSVIFLPIFSAKQEPMLMTLFWWWILKSNSDGGNMVRKGLGIFLGTKLLNYYEAKKVIRTLSLLRKVHQASESQILFCRSMLYLGQLRNCIFLDN